MAQRPDRVILNGCHPLATGLLFAGLGELPNSTHFHDTSLHGNHCTLTDMSVPATATSGWYWDNFLGRWACRYDGSNDYILGPTSNQPAPTTAISVFLWAKWDALGDATHYPVLLLKPAAATWASPYADYAMRISGATPRKLEAGINTLASADNIAYGSTAPTIDGKWHSVGMTFNGLAIDLFLDGKVDGTKALTTAINASGYPLWISAHQGTSTGEYFTGAQSNQLLWDRTLSASEISALADPSNVMLSGLLMPPKRRLFLAGVAGGPYTLTAETGAFALTGQAVGMLAARTVPLAAGTFSETGQDVGLLAARKASVAVGAFTLTGQDIGLFATRKLSMTVGEVALIAHWKLNDNAASTVVVDDSGNSYNGVAARNTSLTYAVGKIVGAYSANGSSDLIRVTDVADFNFGTELTVCAWVKLASAATERVIVGQYDTGANKRGWYLRVNPAHRPQFVATDNGVYTAHAVDAYATVTVDDGNWHHICVTWNSGAVGFVIDGAVYAPTYVLQAAITTIYDGNVDLTLGARLNNNAGANWFTGAIDDVRLYDAVLTLSQVGSIYRAGTGTEDDVPWAIGAFSETGKDVGLLATRKVTASVGTYALTGKSVTLTYSGVTAVASPLYYYLCLGA